MALNIKDILKAKFCKLKFIRLSIAKPFLKSVLKYSRNFSFFHFDERSGFHFCAEASICCIPPLIHWIQLMEFTVQPQGHLPISFRFPPGWEGKFELMPLVNHYLTDFSKLFSQTEFCFQGKYRRLLISVIHLTEFYWIFASHCLEITLAVVKEKARRIQQCYRHQLGSRRHRVCNKNTPGPGCDYGDNARLLQLG